MKYNDYFLESNNIISIVDLKILRSFYLPFLGPNPISLYQYFVDQFDAMQSRRDVFHFDEIGILLNLSSKEIEDAKKRLEAIGLIRFFESDFYKTQILMLQKPLSPELINKNKLICVEIIQKIGLERLENLLTKHLVYKFDKEEYIEKTAKFYDIYKFKIDELSKIANRDKIIESKAKEIKNNTSILSSIEYYELLTKRKIAPSIRKEIENLSNKGFDNTAINHFLEYSYKVNEGQINIRYVATIASSYLEKNIIASCDVAAELAESLIQRIKPKRKYKDNSKTLIDQIDLENLYQFDEEDLKNSSFDKILINNQQHQQQVSTSSYAFVDQSTYESELKSVDEVLEDLLK